VLPPEVDEARPTLDLMPLRSAHASKSMYWTLPQDPDFKYLAWPQGLQCDESIWDMRPDVIQIVRSWADDQDSDVPARHVLLIPNVLVYCDEGVKMLFRQGQQLPILLAAESCVSNGLTFMTAVSKQEFDLPGDTLIEEQFHFKVAVKLVLASSIAAIASALVTLGKSSRNSDSVRPCSR